LSLGRNTVDFLTDFNVRGTADPAEPACDPARDGEAAYQVDAGAYSAIDGDVLLGESFPTEWCMLASVNCDDSQAGQLLYYENADSELEFGLRLTEDGVIFDVGDESYSSVTEDYCDGTWNQFSVCYDGGRIVLHTDCTRSVVLRSIPDPGFQTIGSSLRIFSNDSGENEYSVRDLILFAVYGS